MYSGKLIEELTATVERVEALLPEQSRTDNVEDWFRQSDFALLEQTYQGVA
ncbi:MAG TPA: hypothetical protein VHR84_14310 [Terriglobales bacterium]|jgi:hypothetical protein|nr:hypothetical protein [Terriglobales bacterium]